MPEPSWDELAKKDVPKELDPDDAARRFLDNMREELQEKVAFHESQAKHFSQLAEQHSYAAGQYRIYAEAGDPVPEQSVNAYVPKRIAAFEDKSH